MSNIYLEDLVVENGILKIKEKNGDCLILRVLTDRELMDIGNASEVFEILLGIARSKTRCY